MPASASSHASQTAEEQSRSPLVTFTTPASVFTLQWPLVPCRPGWEYPCSGQVQRCSMICAATFALEIATSFTSLVPAEAPATAQSLRQSSFVP